MPKVNREVLATAADEPEAGPTRKQKWHDQLQRLNPFHKSLAVASSVHELEGILVDPQTTTLDVHGSGGNMLRLVSEDEVSVLKGVIILNAQKRG